ncbi:glycoside hydrolase family 127 protein [Microlunatus elymi]|uniref:Glycoside hydrolase family 127 protein n=1 Tax=Microlunatus elymi TaxID=2596828 RepID=A0A516Q0Z6_9ACTN|nr:beta-L-arabinofuranosidase domain-containing protein [Microlunatus elymi]QDP97096.1 glycoside hydrolase family 127 protein [Microlunatus elymi]
MQLTAAPAGPIRPTASARLDQRPDVRAEITGGLLGHWQQVNRKASIPLGIGQLEQAGNYDNLRLAAGNCVDAVHRGPVYMDSDIYKMLESAGFQLETGADDELIDFVRAAAELIIAAQADDGYLNSYYQVRAPEKRYAELTNSHELYTAGHLLQAAVALARAGHDQLMQPALRLADHLVEVFLDQRCPHLDGHPEVETALVELYRQTGKADYLELARRLIEDRGRGLAGRHTVGSAYFQDALPIREMPILTGHAVRAMYLEAGIVDVAVETDDRSLLDASVRRWQDMVASKTVITGGNGARMLKEAFGEGYELPSDQSYNETCAAVAAIHWSWRLLLATGEARYADLIERTLYNVFGASVSADGTEFFKGNPLQRRHDHEQVIGDPRYRGGWFWSACCPPNVTRLMASLQHYLATSTDDSLTVQQYAAARLSADVAGDPVTLRLESDLPWDGRVMITVDAAGGREWTLRLRQPSWSPTVRLLINQEPQVVEPDGSGYLSLRRSWQRGDSIELILDLRPRLIRAHPMIDAVRGCLAIERGPLVYCFEQADQEPGVDSERLRISPDAPITVLPVEELPGIGRTVRLQLPAEELIGLPADGLPYFADPVRVRTRPVTATALPYFQWSNRDRLPMRVWLPAG